jgi:signal transduction histidine kinase
VAVVVLVESRAATTIAMAGLLIATILAIRALREQRHAVSMSPGIVSSAIASTEVGSLRRELADCETALARTRDEVAQATRVRDEFLATVSHELRTPLNAILGWAELLRTPEGGQAVDLVHGLEVIERNARRQQWLIEELLDVATIDSDTMAEQPVDIEEVVRRAVAQVTPAASAAGVTLETDLGAGAEPQPAEAARAAAPIGAVIGDAGRLQQAIDHVLDNAIRFTPAGGVVHTTVRRAGDEVSIEVADSGIGIAPAFQPHVFDAFRQQDSSASRAYPGLGLGLTIARRWVNAHGGRITATSPGSGSGAAFLITLPLGASRASGWLSPPADVTHAIGPDVRLDGMHVLVVEEDTESVELLDAVLSGAGADFAAASTPGDALIQMTEHPPDVVMSDIGTSGAHGYELLNAIRRLPNRALAAVPVIAISPSIRARESRRALEAGFDLQVAKPIQPRELVSAVSNLFAERSRAAVEPRYRVAGASGQPRQGKS